MESYLGKWLTRGQGLRFDNSLALCFPAVMKCDQLASYSSFAAFPATVTEMLTLEVCSSSSNQSLSAPTPLRRRT